MYMLSLLPLVGPKNIGLNVGQYCRDSILQRLHAVCAATARLLYKMSAVLFYFYAHDTPSTGTNYWESFLWLSLTNCGGWPPP